MKKKTTQKKSKTPKIIGYSQSDIDPNLVRSSKPLSPKMRKWLEKQNRLDEEERQKRKEIANSGCSAALLFFSSLLMWLFMIVF